MTSGRFTRFFAGLLTIAAWGCGGAEAPCTECPAVEGRYRIQFNGGAGVPPECSLLSVALPAGEVLEISRTGDQLTGRLAGVPLSGNIGSYSAFTLMGSTNNAGAPGGARTDTLNLNGSYLAPAAEGGTASISGVFTGTYVRASDTGGQRCTVSSPFSATRD
ncbi:hypothetical protein A176_002803 [Myxococcus hansupus]|uniref:Uncharacterized protein n=1 Tax=Pseudomyxococcus hansupus TaxID=1297742 RepID=A0A0H4WQW2_9BACT|nr:hypothetical protein [Myxococcus hansupus]AKQ65891.1 hypothetical protein A176_002803 [Myxococcus hansupus]